MHAELFMGHIGDVPNQRAAEEEADVVGKIKPCEREQLRNVRTDEGCEEHQKNAVKEGFFVERADVFIFLSGRSACTLQIVLLDQSLRNRSAGQAAEQEAEGGRGDADGCTAFRAEGFKRGTEGCTGAHAAGHGDRSHRDSEQAVQAEDSGETNTDQVLDDEEEDRADRELRTELAALFEDCEAAGEAGAGEENVHEEVLESICHLHGDCAGRFPDENENTAEQSADDRCGDEVFLEERHLALDPSAEHVHAYRESQRLNDV